MDVSLGHTERKKEFLIPMAIARMRIPKAIKSRRYKLRVTGVREREARCTNLRTQYVIVYNAALFSRRKMYTRDFLY